MSKFPTAFTKEFIIPASSETRVDVGGNTVRVISATAGFKISLEDQREEIEVEAGLKFRVDDGGKFNFLVLKNPTVAAITTKLFIGFGDMDDSRLTLTGGSIDVKNLAGTKLNVHPNTGYANSVAFALLDSATTMISAAGPQYYENIFQNTGETNVYIGSTGNLATLQSAGLILESMEKITISGGAPIYAASINGAGQIRRLALYGV